MKTVSIQITSEDVIEGQEVLQGTTEEGDYFVSSEDCPTFIVIATTLEEARFQAAKAIRFHRASISRLETVSLH